MYQIDLDRPLTCRMAGRVRQTRGWEHDGRIIGWAHLLVFLIDGQATFSFAGETYAARRGDTILVPKKTYFTANTDVGCEYFFLHVDVPLTEGEFPSLPREMPLPFSFILPRRQTGIIVLPPHLSTGERYPAFYARFRDCVGEATAPGSTARLLVDLDAARLLARLSALFTETVSDDLPQCLIAALTHIRTHLRKPISIAELSETVHLSPSYLARLFKRHLHTTPTAYINREKLHYARELLRNTDMTVTEIAEYLGYCDVFYFSRLYKRMFGHAPTHERE